MSTHRWLPLRVVFLVAALGAALVVNPVSAVPAVTPIVGGSSFGTAVLITPGVQYSAQVKQTTHITDYFYFDVTPGQYLTLNFSSGVIWTGAGFYLYDQDHVNPLVTGVTISGPEQARTFRYLGNSTTPTRYYFVAMYPTATNDYLFDFTLADQMDGGTAGDAGDTPGTAKTVTATQGSQTLFAGNQLGYEDTHDWLKILALSGQIIKITMSVTDFGAQGSYPGPGNVVFQVADQTGTTILDTKVIPNPSTEPWTYSWMSNNTHPSAYLVHAQTASNNGRPVRYDVAVDLSQQQDGGAPGDAGDNFDTARVLAVNVAEPVLVAPGNMMGGSDRYDYYRLNLPAPPPMEFPRHYRLTLDQVVWPELGKFTVKLFDGNRTPLSGQLYYINAPSTAPLTIDITNCSLTGCYMSIETLYYEKYRTSYRLQLTPTQFVYLPMVKR